MWYKLSKEQDKQTPSYELKIIAMDAALAIRKLEFLLKQRNAIPDKEISNKVNLVIDYIKENYGSIANLRLYTKGDSLQELVSQIVYKLFGGGSSK
jgi:hypothetical protein